MAEKKIGSFKIFNNQGSFTVPVDADQLTDGSKSLQVQIRRTSINGPIIGTLSSPITVNDTSFTPAGTLIRSECRGVDKWGIYANGSGGTYDQLIQQNSSDCGYTPPSTDPPYGTILSQGCVPGTYTYRIVKADGNGGSFNEDTPNSVQCGYIPPPNNYGGISSISFTPNVGGVYYQAGYDYLQVSAPDLPLNSGGRHAVIKIIFKNQNTVARPGYTSSYETIYFNEISLELIDSGAGYLYPPEIKILDLDFYGNAINPSPNPIDGSNVPGPGVPAIEVTNQQSLIVPTIAVPNVGTLAFNMSNGSTIRPAIPTYSFTRSASSVNEGGSFTITFNTNQSGSFPYTITGVSSSDINGDSLNGNVSNGQTLTFNVTADSVTEGAETFVISLNNGQANTSVVINDTSTAPSVTTRSVNWTPSSGSLVLFVANKNFTGWIGDITKSNIQIDNTERNSIIYDPIMRQKITELIQYMQTQFGVTIDESNIDAELNRGIDSYNSIINEALGNNTAGVYLLAETPKLTNQNSFDFGGKRYTRTTLKYSAVDFGYLNDIDVNGTAEELTTALITELNNNGISVNASQRTQIKNLIIAVLQLLSNILNSITDKVDLYDYTEQLI